MHSVVRPDDSYKYLCWRCLAQGGAATARGGAPQPVVQELRVPLGEGGPAAPTTAAVMAMVK